MSRYFDRFPLINYDGTIAKNIMARVDFTEETKRDIYSNFDYVLKEGQSRPDMLSYAYYNSSQYDWLIYLSNDVIDPYHDYYKSDSDMQQFIIGKYGSLALARQKILYYRNDWASDDSTIALELYDTLDINIKRYWSPVINMYDQVISYTRNQEDWISSTNKILSLEVSSVDGFNIGDTVYQDTTHCSAEVVSIDTINSRLIVHHVTSEFEIDTFVLAVTLLYQPIPQLGSAFWAPVSAYDYEMEQNELKKHINLIKSSYLPDVEKLFIEQISK